MKLQTQIQLREELHHQIDYNSKVLMLGSCFVGNIGEKLEYYKFQSLINPFGILFHPLAIENLITNAINNKTYADSDVFFENEQWHCFEAHSQLSNPSKDNLLGDLNNKIQLTRKQIYNSTHIVITLGTAWVYRHIETDAVVANCHKVPQKKFLKELLSVEDILESLKATVALIKRENPRISILFTVSPVRHLKDGFIENTQSKAHLITAIHQMVSPRDQMFYFPSYEIMMDELRDYRFYNEDMLHPNTTAINYIWEKFKFVWINTEAKKVCDEVEAIQKGLQHKPFNPNSNEHQKFLQKLEAKAKVLQSRFSHIKF